MSAPSVAFPSGGLSEMINKEFSSVNPGFVESSESPVMWTPVIVPAAVIATQASALSAFC